MMRNARVSSFSLLLKFDYGASFQILLTCERDSELLSQRC